VLCGGRLNGGQEPGSECGDEQGSEDAHARSVADQDCLAVRAKTRKF
jgi:hypothetical protein